MGVGAQGLGWRMAVGCVCVDTESASSHTSGQWKGGVGSQSTDTVSKTVCWGGGG